MLPSLVPRRMKSGIALYGMFSLCLAVAYFTRWSLPVESVTARTGGTPRGGEHQPQDPHEADGNEADLERQLVIMRLGIGHSPALGNESRFPAPMPPSQSHGGRTSPNEDTTQGVNSKKVLEASTSPPAWSHRNGFPRIIIIGFGKSGTRALYDALLMHPQLQGPKREVRYFDTHYDKGLTWYLQQMPSVDGGVSVMEKSPSYIIHPISAQRLLETVKELQIDLHTLKFVVMVRDPIQRAVSEYLEWNVLRLYLSRNTPRHPSLLPPFDKMVYDKSGQIDLGGVPVLNASVYSFHLSNWIHYFPPSQLCIVDGDNFAKDPYQEVHSLESCLGLKRFFTEQNFVYVPDRGFYCFQESSHSRLLCENRSKGRPHPPLPEQVLMDLKKAYKPYNEQLQKLTNRSYSWL